ncbi:Plexin-A2, partial [Stegodyphus mimosarum]
MDVNTPLGGSMPIEATPVLTYSGLLLTSVAATSTHDYTVAFMGTATGHLKKAVVESVTSAFEYSDLQIDEGKSVSPDMLFDKNKEFLYVMTERRVTMVKVQECLVYKTCTECLDAQDPYCGWCSLENKCSLRSDCAEAAQDPLYWLSYKSGKCTTITSVHPPQIQRTTARILNLVIDNLPVLEGQFYCAFTALGKSLVSNASRLANGVSCATPHTDSLPAIPPAQHHFTAKLSVRMKTGPDFVATNFTFYDCSTYTSCTQCVSSPFPCDWCVGGHRCTHDTGENCRNDILVTGISSIGPSIRSGPGFCPRINTTSGGSIEILVPSGISKRIQVKVDNIQPIIASTRFVCQFNIEGRVRQVHAQLLGDTIYCDPMVFAYGTQAPNITTAFAVIWDGSKPLDNPENIHVLVYRCQGMAQNCGICLELPDKYSCGWCQDPPSSCQVHEQCSTDPTQWLDHSQTCPDPKITRFYPESGPWEGGTNITIEGINLGRVFEDVAGGVKVVYDADGRTIAECLPHKENYRKTSKIVCQVESPRNLTTGLGGGSISGPIVVKVQNDYIARSQKHYSFVNPRITSVVPSKGPRSGGTKLKIWGLHMDAGSRAEAFVDGLECKVTGRRSNYVDCTTSASKDKGPGKVRVKFDNGLRIFEDYNFLYVDDPVIGSVESGSGQRGTPKGIPSGGISITVHGTNLNAVQQPMMYVLVDNQEYTSTCKAESSTEMKCWSPAVPPSKLDFSGDEAIELDFGFLMDNVEKVKNLSERPGFPKFYMYPDPLYYKFTEENHIKYYKSDYLTINGQNLDRASQESDVLVRIGTSYCNVTSLSRSQLTCRPPTSQPHARDISGLPVPGQLPEVVVEVGDILKFPIGKLSYELPSSHDSALSKPVIIGVIVGGCILVIIVIIILIAYRQKSTESSRVLKNMQEQMDVLELRVASECKEAFAELQTEMTDLTSDLTAGGIPFLDYQTYAMKVLFPNSDDHPVLREMQ